MAQAVTRAAADLALGLQPCLRVDHKVAKRNPDPSRGPGLLSWGGHRVPGVFKLTPRRARSSSFSPFLEPTEAAEM